MRGLDQRDERAEENELRVDRQTLRENPKVVVFRIAGEVDETNGRQAETYFTDLMSAQKPHDVLLDLGGLTFGSSGFFGSLLFWKEEVAKGSGQLVLFGLRPEIASTLRIFSLDRVVSICADRQAALDKLGLA
jgi:anti-anti-sigma factor